MIKLIRRLPQIRNLPTINVDNIVQYCVSIPQDNDIIDIDFSPFGQFIRLPKWTENKKPADIWQVVESCQPYLHVHYVEEVKPGRFKVILTAIYEETTGNLVTYHLPNVFSKDKLKNVHQWNAEKFTFSLVPLDDQKMDESPYVAAWGKLADTLFTAQRYPILPVADLDKVNRKCTEAELACHSQPAFLDSWIDEIYACAFGLQLEPEINTSRILHDVPGDEILHGSDLEKHLVTGSIVDMSTAKDFEQSFQELLSKSSGIVNMRSDSSQKRTQYHNSHSFVMAGDLIIHFLRSAITNLEIEYRYAASEGKLYITKGECSNELIDTKKPINLKNASEVSSELKRWVLDLAKLLTTKLIKPHTPEDFNLSGVKVTFADFNLIVQLISADKKRKSLSIVLPMLSVVSGIPIVEWRAGE